MSKEIKFNEDQLDCFCELINISYGTATASISDMLNSFATLKVPKIKILPSSELKTYLLDRVNKNDEQFVATQHLVGDILGENLFLIDKSSAINLAKGFEIENNEINNDDVISDIVLEVINILSSTALRKLSEELRLTVFVEPPIIEKIDSITNLDNSFLEEYQQIIIISSSIEFKEQNIEASFMLLTKDESILLIQSSINKILEKL
ncbi:MAG: chemotaxis protein CheC [Campylobacterota bacterium]|nr:chemotaxis protein CheC [Campylobacterota bacterium]